jgi:hypothetical protein
MHLRTACTALSAFAFCVLPLVSTAANLTPGMYEYTTTMNMPGMPAGMGTHVSQQCLTQKDIASNNAFNGSRDPNSDCQMKDFSESGNQFSYKMSCTKPQKMDSIVKGTFTSTSMTMDMTMAMNGRPMSQTTTVKRIGDCTK